MRVLDNVKRFFLRFANSISKILYDLYNPPLSLLARVPIYSMLVSNCRKWNIFSLSYTVLELDGAIQELGLFLDHFPFVIPFLKGFFDGIVLSKMMFLFQ